MIVQTLPFQTLITINKDAPLPVYEQIANGIINLIRTGKIQPGYNLPPSRQMAALLNVHRKTVLAAYEELSTQDWITSLPRKGMTVSLTLPDYKPLNFAAEQQPVQYSHQTPDIFIKNNRAATPVEKKNIYRMAVNDGFPDARIAPVDTLLKQYNSFLQKSYVQGLFMHGDAAGSFNLRHEIAAFLLHTRGIQVETGNILITRGAQMAIYIAASRLLWPGSTVIVGEPGYSMANKIFEHFGATLLRVPVDENGIDVDAIEQLCMQQKPDLLYIIPHHHHPTTVTLSAERRTKLLQLISNYSLPVIEDDYDYDFHYNKSPLLPLASANTNGYVLYIGSVTKSFASAVRIGYLIGGVNLIAEAASIRELIDIRGDVLMEEALAVLYKNGTMYKHLNKAVKLYRSRRDSFCELLHNHLDSMITFVKPQGGMAVWVKFNKEYNLAEIAGKMAQEGIYINDGSIYNCGNINHNALRMGFASMNMAEMEELIKTLKQFK